ncbi:ric8 guanine nucleotide exchange factor A isoform X5 [Rhipicephalus microplus]|uniref:ric8 guanine nucleotide exchange factor A isoform X5 n=1 Tax=Rhipicephalus microplus TaxID=6941 RepID=UPI003F6D0082
MGLSIVDQLLAVSNDQAELFLKEFNAKHAQIFTFPDLSLDDRRVLVSRLMELVSSDRESCQLQCLETLRLLSRDRCHLEEVFSADVLAQLARMAQLAGRPSEELGQLEQLHAPAVVEALKTLCNLIYNSSTVQKICSHNGCVEGVMLRLKLYGHPHLPHDVKFFDMRMLFLLTALCADTRPRLRTELHGLTYLRETLDLILKLSEERTVATQSSSGLKRCMRHSRRGRHAGGDDSIGTTPVLSAEDASLAAEVLKVLYNLTCGLDKFHVEEVETKPNFYRQLTPVLLCLAECGRGHRILRRYLRARVLPPLKDVMTRPESGSTLRNRLVRLMTVPCTDTKQLVAELLFVLCKEKVGRLIKYTGYGNAAGLLARRGLLRVTGVLYSSDSEDSDTEEYLKHRDHINPVLGCHEPVREPPLQAMSEEQKEHEAMKLVNLMDQLTRVGVVQPARVGVDGRPCPIEHVLELQEDRDLAESD